MKFPPLKRWLRFRLWMLLLAFIPAGMASLWLKDYLDTRPIVPQPYTDAELQRHLDEGRPVMVIAVFALS